MNPKRTVMTTWLAMLGLQTIGSIDAKHRLPAPKQYIAIGALWGILFLVAETRFARTAAQLSGLVLLTASIIGPFGKRVIDLLNAVSQNFAVPPDTGAGPLPSAGPTAPVPSNVSPA
jgi:hypothetical protein